MAAPRRGLGQVRGVLGWGVRSPGRAWWSCAEGAFTSKIALSDLIFAWGGRLVDFVFSDKCPARGRGAAESGFRTIEHAWMRRGDGSVSRRIDTSGVGTPCFAARGGLVGWRAWRGQALGMARRSGVAEGSAAYRILFLEIQGIFT